MESLFFWSFLLKVRLNGLFFLVDIKWHYQKKEIENKKLGAEIGIQIILLFNLSIQKMFR